MICRMDLSDRIPFYLVGKETPIKRAQKEPKDNIFYIGGSDILPAPLPTERENEMIRGLGTEKKEGAKAILIEHNLRLVVYIAKKFDNTGVGVED